MADQTKDKYLILTCDTEALMKEAPESHVDRLIWGKFPNAPYDAGIELMMLIAEEHGAKISFFYDVLERLQYGEEIDRGARYILDRGHDLQLHLHIEFLKPDFWRTLGYYPVTWAMNLFNYQTARCVLDYGIGLFEEMAGHRPVAYRGGAFRYNSNMLKALHDCGIPLSFNYYPLTVYMPSYPHGFDAGLLPVFKWSNGVVEVPGGVYENPHPRQGKSRYTGAQLHELRDFERWKLMLESYWQTGPEFQVIVMVLHSWSFLERDEAGHFTWKGERNLNLFRQILSNLPPDVRVITASELHTKIQEGMLKPRLEMPLCVAGTEGFPLFRLSTHVNNSAGRATGAGASDQKKAVVVP